MPTRIPKIPRPTVKTPAKVLGFYSFVGTLVVSGLGVRPVVADVLPLEGVVEEARAESCSFRELTVTEKGEGAGAGNLVDVGDENDVAMLRGAVANKVREDGVEERVADVGFASPGAEVVRVIESQGVVDDLGSELLEAM